MPIPEVRIAESESAAYARISTEDEIRRDDFSLADALITMLEMRGSDLHLTAGAPPTVRVDGSLRPIPDTVELTPETIQRVMYSIVTQQQRERFEETLELDFSYALPEVAALPGQPVQAARLARRRLPRDPVRDQEPRVAGHAAGDGQLRAAAPRLRPGDRADRLGQVHDARRADRPRQPDRATSTS